MNNALQVFDFEDRQVRIVTVNEEPWWVLRDVCDVLGLTTPARVAERLEKDEVSQTHLTDSVGRKQETIIVNESGLYNVILRSDKPDAKKFRKWVTSEVLPAIRRHGAYMTPEMIERALINPDFIIRLARNLRDEQEKTKTLASQIERERPLVLYAKTVEASDSLTTPGEFAKMLRQNGFRIGKNTLFEWLGDSGYVIRGGRDHNMPSQRAVERGYLEIEERVRNNAKGRMVTERRMMLTGKGSIHFANRLVSERATAFQAKRQTELFGGEGEGVCSVQTPTEQGVKWG
jgi:prophage antirepressor-like protein